MEFIDQSIQTYAEEQSGVEPELLKELNRYTHAKVLMPRMLSGHLQGRFLSMLSRMIHPRFVLEIGTYTGYSALCLAEGLQDEGALYTIDNNEEVVQIAKEFFDRSPFSGQITAITGDAILEIEKIKTKVPHWDLIWIDADKTGYSDYYEACLPHLRSGGVILADNVLWSGKVLDKDAIIHDKDTKALDQFNNRVRNDKRVDNLLLPIRDGIMMIRKK